MKLWKKTLIGFSLLCLVLVLYVLISVRSLSVEQLSDDLFVLRGMGGNVTVLKTDAGTVVIDSMTFTMQGGLIKSKAEALTDKPVSVLINTHYHLDHTHGNPSFKAGTQVVATDRTLSHLKALDADFWQGDASKLLPNDTFSGERTLNMGNKTLRLVQAGNGHTDGDLVVLIEQEKTIVMGDLFFNEHYPNIDLEAGGSVQQWPATLDAVLALDFNRVIPGHGATTNRLGIQKFQRFMGQLKRIGNTAAADQASLEETLQTTVLDADKNYTEIKFAGIPLGLDREFVITRAWEESTGNFERKN